MLVIASATLDLGKKHATLGGSVLTSEDKRVIFGNQLVIEVNQCSQWAKSMGFFHQKDVRDQLETVDQTLTFPLGDLLWGNVICLLHFLTLLI